MPLRYLNCVPALAGLLELLQQLIDVAQSLGHDTHDLHRKVRRLPHQVNEAFFHR